MTTCAPTKDIFLVHSEELRSINDGYPTVGMVIDEILENGPDREDWDDETVSEAISKWDAHFADNSDWYSEDDSWCNDDRDSLRFDVEGLLGLEF